ncbi:MAG: DUF937 domain-containing protein [Acidobacteriota bacterium]
MFLQNILNEQLSGDTIGQMSQTLGADESAVGNAIQAALPMLIGALARNSANEEGANSLHTALSNDHDGGILDNILGVIAGGGTDSSAGILGHIFGGRQQSVEQGISQSSGLDAATVARLLMMLAPIVMGALGKTQRQQGLDAQGVAGLLDQERQQQESSSPLMGMLGQLLDRDHDGSAVDDIFGMVGGLLKNRG